MTNRKILLPFTAALSVSLAFSGVPSFDRPLSASVPAAEAATQSIYRIAQVGPGITKNIKVGLNKAIVIDLPVDAHDILVANPEVADAVTRTSTRLYVFGKAVGQTNVFVFGAGGEELITIDLAIERDITNLQAQLKRFIPESDINVEIISDNIVLTGSVRTPQDAAQAVSLADAFVTGGEATTRNISASASSSTGDTEVGLFNEDRQKSAIINMLTIEAEDQVTLKVTVAEVSRQVIKQLGFNTSIFGSKGAISFQNPTNLGSSVNWFTGSNVGGSLGPFDISTYVNAMEQAGVMRTLAEPSLTAISGQEANFYVGGEFRMASQQNITNDNGGGTKVTRNSESVEYGIRLNFTPVVLSPGRISLKIETDVSEPTFEGAFTSVASQNVPAVTYLGIRKREASTSVELPSGGSIVIAGLVRDDIRQATSGMPALMKLPILGSLFRSKDFQRNETELVIIATPYLVRPMERSKLARPDDNFNPEGDVAMYFLNRVNKVYGRRENAKVPGRYNGTIGFIYK
jgi:pilus assembly protein CpaC